MTLLPSTCPGGATFEFPNHPFSLGTMGSNDTFVFDTIYRNAGQGGANSASPDIQRDSAPNTKLQARVNFVAGRLAKIPRTFAEQGQTIFIQRIQFQETSSLALRDAMSACALYSMKSAANQTLVLQDLEHKCRQLIACTDALLASKADLLAALQALVLYQMIRLFDGDIRLRAQAEADEPVAILWASQLMAHMCYTARAITSTSTSTAVENYLESDWPSWLLHESIRRTVISTYMLHGVYSFLKLGYDSPAELRVYFTAQSALWGAQTEVGWHRALEETERLEVQVIDWEETIAKASPSDLEELGVLIMIMLWGLDATRKWLGKDFSMKHGLEAV